MTFWLKILPKKPALFLHSDAGENSCNFLKTLDNNQIKSRTKIRYNRVTIQGENFLLPLYGEEPSSWGTTPASFCRPCARSESRQKRLPSKQALPHLLLQVGRWNPYFLPVHLPHFLQQLQHGAGINRLGQRLTVRFLFQA